MPNLSLIDITREWLQWLKGRKLSPATVRNYHHRMAVFLTWFEDTYHYEPTTNDIAGEAGAKLLRQFMVWYEREREVSPATLNLTRAAIRGMARYAVLNSYLDDTTIHRVQKAKPNSRETAVLSDDQVAAIEATMHQSEPVGFRDYLLFNFLLETGLRCSELCHLQVGDLRLREASGRPVLKGIATVLGKGNKSRPVGFGLELTRLLARYLSTEALRKPKRGCEAVFVNRWGTPFTPERLEYTVSRWGKRIGIHLHPHMLRHTFAVNYLADRGDIAELQYLMGHTNAEQTLHYARLRNADRAITRQQQLSRLDTRRESGQRERLHLLQPTEGGGNAGSVRKRLLS